MPWNSYVLYAATVLATRFLGDSVRWRGLSATARFTQNFSRQAIKVLLVGWDDDVLNTAGNF